MRTFALLGALVAALTGAAQVVEVLPDRTDVVIATDAPPAVRLAAEEMTNFLSRVLACEVPVVHAPQAGRLSLVLGVNAWSKAAGVDPTVLSRDSFVTRAEPGRIYIAGVDDPKVDFRLLVEKLGLGGLYALERDGQRATLFGVYDFLERHAGVRFYFPGELGTVMPRRDRLAVPVGETRVTPAFLVRRPYLPRDGVWPGETDDGLSRNVPKSWTWLRQRFSTYRFQCVHGQNEMQLAARFAKDHPEYFALLKDGTRTCEPKTATGPNTYLRNMVCQSSKVWDEIYEDARAFLMGQPASVRGVPDIRRPGTFAWGGNCARQMVDVMPHDGMLPCACPDCRAAYALAADPEEYATELMWGQTAKVGRRLIEAGVPGFLTQMAYTPYRAVPKVDIPTNVLVMVAEQGPWSSEEEIAAQEREVSAWHAKLGRPVWIWTYPGKHSRQNVVGIPQSTPRAYGRYFKRLAPYVFGSFCESESDCSIFNYLNYYVFSRIAWDAKADVDAVLAEHHRLMFGAAAGEMAAFFDALEDAWQNGVVGTFVTTETGRKMRHYASELELFTSIYARERLRTWDGWLRTALGKVPEGSLEAKRIRFVRENFFSPIVKRAVRFRKSADVKAEQARRAAATSRLLPLAGRWKTTPGTCSHAKDAAVRLVSSESMRFEKHVTSRNEGEWGTLGYTFPREGEGALKPGRRYRVSCFLKLKGVRPLDRPHYFSHAGGVCFGVSGFGGRAVHSTEPNYFIGDADWFAQSVEFAYDGKKPSDAVEAYVRFYVADGTVWIDGFRVEEILEKLHVGDMDAVEG